MKEQLKVSMFKNIAIGNRWIWQSFNQDYIPNKESTWIKEFLNTPVCRIASKEVSSKLKNDWVKYGLIEDKRVNNLGWHKFTIAECIWIKIVLRLKKFNFSNSQIKQVRECLKFSSSQCSISDMPYLDFFIIQASLGSIIQLAVTNNGEAYFVTTYQLATLKQLTKFSDYISIDLNSIVKDIFPKTSHNYTKVVELSEMEEIAIKSIREISGIKSIQINIKENEIKDLEREIFENTSKKLIDIAKEIEFGEFTPKVHKGKIVRVSRKEKFKPSKIK